MDRDAGLLDLMIARIPGLGGNERISLAKRFDNEDDFSLLSINDIEKVLAVKLKNKSWKMDELRNAAEKDAAAAFKFGVRRVSWRERAYPPLLREIFDPPVVLYYRGRLPDPEKPLAAVVGTRKPSSRGAERAFLFGKELGFFGIPVVSGLALGIDSMAHRGNIEGKAPTVAVLGSSPEQVYPSSNRPLARRIIETGGAVISEYPPGTGPMKWNFPARNRIISALARGTLVVEAPEKSGALITARFAVEHNRDVWVDRDGFSSPCGRGALRLAEEGARVISSAGEIADEWNISGTVKGAERNGVSERGLAGSLADYLEIALS